MTPTAPITSCLTKKILTSEVRHNPPNKRLKGNSRVIAGAEPL